MKQGSNLLLEIAGAAVGIYLLLPDAAFFLKTVRGEEYLTFRRLVENGGHALPYLALLLLPAPRLLKKLGSNKLRSALAVLVFSGLTVVLARALHPFLIDVYVFIITVHKDWASLAMPVLLFGIIAANWGAAFGELYRVTKVAGE